LLCIICSLDYRSINCSSLATNNKIKVSTVIDCSSLDYREIVVIKRIHVNQHHIRHNLKNPDDQKPVLTVKTSKSNTKCDRVVIHGTSEVIYSPDKPLACGAKVWIETQADLEIFGEDRKDQA